MTGFLDDVLKPGEGAQMAVVRELEQRRRQFGHRPGYYYRGAGDLLLQHGKFYNGRKLPDKYAHLMGSDGNCYDNALRAAEADPSLRYCEGVYAIVGRDFHGHAWCIDPEDRVVEVSLPTDENPAYQTYDERLAFLPVNRWGYFGLIVTTAYIRAHRDAYSDRCMAMFDLSPTEATRLRAEGRYGEDIDWPILKQPFDPNRTTL